MDIPPTVPVPSKDRDMNSVLLRVRLVVNNTVLAFGAPVIAPNRQADAGRQGQRK